MATAFAISRPGSMVGAIGVPHNVDVPFKTNIWRDVGLQGGVAPVRRYIPELVETSSAARSTRPLFRFEIGLEHRRRLRGDGPTAGDQVPRSGWVDLMATWTDEELDRIGGATELQVTSVRQYW